jgi:uncharacterized protein DUF6326
MPEGEAMDALADVKVHVKMKLSALWVSVMLCHIYGDYFELYESGKLQGMLEGRMGPLGPVTQGVLLGASILMTIPSVMVFLSLALKPVPNRWANIVLGAVYTAIMLAIMMVPGIWVFYRFLAAVEVVLTGLIVWYAWTWPRQEARGENT